MSIETIADLIEELKKHPPMAKPMVEIGETWRDIHEVRRITDLYDTDRDHGRVVVERVVVD
jgi:hypothetical protein